YTGSAGWYFRAVCKAMLGLWPSGGTLRPAPRLPGELPVCAVTWVTPEGELRQLTLGDENEP
ncbi:MAG: hypothetical protein J5927_04800, partial [Oscillospiraceae bacterium]|nr:hypothetical protein [Oscillospiraceae bacterium]